MSEKIKAKCKAAKTANSLKIASKKIIKAAHYTAKFGQTQLTVRAKKVAVFIKEGPASLKEIADAVFARERPATKRNSWARNQMRVLRGHKLVTRTARKGDKPTVYALRKGADLQSLLVASATEKATAKAS